MARTLTLSLLVLYFLQATPSAIADGASANERMKSCDPVISLAAAEEVLSSPQAWKEPLELFGPAAILFQRGKKDEGVFWFYAAQLRTRYQLAFEKGDRGQLLNIMVMTVGPPINNYAFSDTSNFRRVLDKVLEWDKTTPNPYRELPRADLAQEQIEKVYRGLRDLKNKIESDKVAIESKAREEAPLIQAISLQQANQRCPKENPLPVISDEAKRDWRVVTDYVKSNPDVIREAGKFEHAVSHASYKAPGDAMPTQYMVWILNNGKRPTYAVVDVARSSGETIPSLVCITHRSRPTHGQLREVCNEPD